MCECVLAVLYKHSQNIIIMELATTIGRIECMVNLALDVHADTAIHHNSKQGPVHVWRTN